MDDDFIHAPHFFNLHSSRGMRPFICSPASCYYLFLDFSLQKQSIRITTRTLILGCRQKGHAFTRAGGFIAAAGHYIFSADRGLMFFSSSIRGAPHKMVGATGLCHYCHAHTIYRKAAAPHTHWSQPAMINPLRALAAHFLQGMSPCKWHLHCQISPSKKVAISLGGVVTNNYQALPHNQSNWCQHWQTRAYSAFLYMSNTENIFNTFIFFFYLTEQRLCRLSSRLFYAVLGTQFQLFLVLATRWPIFTKCFTQQKTSIILDSMMNLIYSSFRCFISSLYCRS